MTSVQAQDAPEHAVKIEGLSHRYGGALALDNISLALPARKTIGLIGPDGVGKSTLLGLLTGVKRIQKGSVQTLGCDLSASRARQDLSMRLAFMPQGLGRNLYPALSVYENADFFARLFGLHQAEREARIKRLLAATGLTPFSARPAGKLSGGMKQKLGLCCSLVHDPDLLVLDEPTTGVDPLSRRQFWALIDSLRAERPEMTVIVATAYMEEAERFEHLVAMDRAHVLIDAPTAEVIARTDTRSLEDAYISLLPEERQTASRGFSIPPYQDPGGDPAIEAWGLTRRFGDFVAVDNVSFRIPRGEIFGFIGSNGCGKTTTMKMLTGLIDITSGSAKLLGTDVDASDMSTRLRIGYMSQAFSLYEELTVRHNLMLHAQLYRTGSDKAAGLVEKALKDFALVEHASAMPASLPLGIRQRLQLAAACLHSPEVLILDEPTSGVDPEAREMFWRHLIRLSREQHVTIFVSTHFMNEAGRCDRMSLMHRGRVLAVGAPEALRRERGMASLEETFIAYLEDDERELAASQPQEQVRPDTAATPPATAKPSPPAQPSLIEAWVKPAWAFALRETKELARDPLRLSFAFIGPLVLLCIASIGISFDVAGIRFSVLDEDQSNLSREFIQHFEGSRFFRAVPPVQSWDRADTLLRNGTAKLIIAVPSGFSRDLLGGRRPEVGFFIDGSVPFAASNISIYASGIMLEYAKSLAKYMPGAPAGLPVSVEPRFVYNQEFLSIYVMTPGVLMLTMILIPAMLTALGIVREKEAGSITNLYASPATIGQYLLGKQLPYAAVAMMSFFTLVFTTVYLFGVPLKGSFLALSFGALLFVFAVTALGLLISSLVDSQIAAIFGTAIFTLIPTVNFCGFLYPVSTLPLHNKWIGLIFPSSWFQLISLGAFTKGLGASSFLVMYAALFAIALFCMLAARLLLKKQEG